MLVKSNSPLLIIHYACLKQPIYNSFDFKTFTFGLLISAFGFNLVFRFLLVLLEA